MQAQQLQSQIVLRSSAIPRFVIITWAEPACAHGKFQPVAQKSGRAHLPAQTVPASAPECSRIARNGFHAHKCIAVTGPLRRMHAAGVMSQPGHVAGAGNPVRTA